MVEETPGHPVPGLDGLLTHEGCGLEFQLVLVFKLTLHYCHIREISLTTLLHLVPRGYLLVALLDAGAGHGGEELRLPDTVGEVVHCSPVAAQTWTVGIEL